MPFLLPPRDRLVIKSYRAPAPSRRGKTQAARVTLTAIRHIKKRAMFLRTDNGLVDDCAGRRYATSYRALKKVLSRIHDSDLNGKILLDMFGGHGAYSFVLASGIRSPIFPYKILTTDIEYGRSAGKQILKDWETWQALFSTNITLGKKRFSLTSLAQTQRISLL